MGNCASGALPPDFQGIPRCVECGQEGSQPIWGMPEGPSTEREQWVLLGRGARRRWCHHACEVARRLELARFRRERASYARAKSVVYPAPAASLRAKQADESSHQLGRFSSLPLEPLPETQQLGPEQLADSSSCSSVLGCSRPVTPRTSLDQSLQRCMQSNGPPALLQGLNRASSLGRASLSFPPAGGEGSSGSSSDSSSSSMLHNLPSPCVSDRPTGLSRLSISSAASSATRDDGSGSNCDTPSAHGPRLHRPSPIRLPALLEARKIRRLSGGVAWDSLALQADPDGSSGRQWFRQQLEEQALRGEQALLARAAAAPRVTLSMYECSLTF